MKRFLFFLCLFFIYSPVWAMESKSININIYIEEMVGFNDGDFTFDNEEYNGEALLYKDDVLFESYVIENGFISIILEEGAYVFDVEGNKFPFMVVNDCDNFEFLVQKESHNFEGTVFKEKYNVNLDFIYYFEVFSNEKFSLYNSENICNFNCEVILEKNTLLASFYTDSNGGFNFSYYLPEGKYYFLFNEVRYDFEMINSDFIFGDIYLETLKGDFKIIHQDFFSGDLISEMKIDIYDTNNNYLFSKESVAGEIVLFNMPYGEYYFIQTENNEKYELLDDEIFFSIDDEELILKGYPKEVLPDTMSFDFRICFSLFIVIFLLFKRKCACF